MGIAKRTDQGRIASRPIEDRFIERIKEPFDAHNECWIWTGAKTGSGYGQIWLDTNRRECAHRIAYEMFVGPIPQGFHVDHLCSNRACVRPDHLGVLTRKENVSQWNNSKTHCRNGHPYDEENTYRKPDGERRCRVCHNRIALASYHRRKGGK
jgi:hypothetical protein